MMNLLKQRGQVGSAGLWVVVMAGAALTAAAARAEDWTMWGRTPQRNMVSDAKGIPSQWDVESRKNIKWVSPLGSQTYGNAVVAGGLIFVGTNNETKRDPRYTADGGVLMCFRESDGKFLWQAYSAKLKSGRVNDWPYLGVCSTALVQGDLLWYCTNRGEVVCFDISPLRQEKGEPREVWRVDMMGQLGVFQHNMVSCSILPFEDLVYVITGNGVDDTHKNIPAPKAPSIVCFEKNTGKVVWSDNSPGENILHGQWSSPALAKVNGRDLILCALGDGWVYAYEARTGKIVWRFDANRKHTVYPTTRNELIATPVIVGNYMYIATGHDPEHGEGPGVLWCVDITKEGDISLELSDRPKPKIGQEMMVPVGGSRAGKPNPNSAVVWYFEKDDADGDGKISGPERMHRTISTVAVHNGLVFAPDFSGFVHCLDAQTGKRLWVHDTEAAIWGSPLVVDGKVYISDESGKVNVLEASRSKKLVAANDMGSPVYSSPVLANGVLYITSRERLFAIKAGN